MPSPRFFSFLLFLVMSSVVTAGQSVYIRVTDNLDLPVAGAKVEVVNENNPALSFTAITDSMGWAALSGLSAGVEAIQNPAPVRDYVLIENFPNPFTSRTTIFIHLPGVAKIHAAIYNVLGEQVAVLEQAESRAGRHIMTWDGRNEHGERVAPGIYFATVKMDGKTHVRKMLLTQEPNIYEKGLFSHSPGHLNKPFAILADTYRFTISDTMSLPRFETLYTSVTLQDTLNFMVQRIPREITRIVAEGSIEQVWDWEDYHNPAAITYRGTNGACNTFDAPPHFWKDADGNVYCIAANGVNYRVPFTADFKPKRQLSANDIVFNSARTYPADGDRFYHKGYGEMYLAGSCTEADYDNNIWVFSLWTDDGKNIFALGHHEFYPRTCPVGTTAPWINAIHHLSSSDSGRTFLPKAYMPFELSGISNSDRLVLIPKPWDASNPDHINYGFYHPSNIVKEGEYYYAAVEGNFWLGTTRGDYGLHEGGLVLIRTKEVSVPTGWQVYTENGWEAIDHQTYQGSGGQEVKLWLKHGPYDPYHEYPRGGQLMSFSLVRHINSGKWIALGYSNQGAVTVHYALTNSLSDPDFGPITAVENAPVLNLGQYMSLVSHDSPGQVFQFVNDEAYLYFVAPNNAPQIPLQLQKPVTDAHSRSLWRVPVRIYSE